MTPTTTPRPDNPGGNLLHNMSAPPAASIAHKAPAGRTYGIGLVCRIPDDCQKNATKNATAWLSILDNKRRRIGAERAESELRDRLNRHAREVGLPPAAVVQDAARQGDRDCTDLLTVLTVLAKSAGHVYLRDKEPDLARLVPGRRVVVVVPPRKTRSKTP